jgi:hypothetical protein
MEEMLLEPDDTTLQEFSDLRDACNGIDLDELWPHGGIIATTPTEENKRSWAKWQGAFDKLKDMAAKPITFITGEFPVPPPPSPVTRLNWEPSGSLRQQVHNIQADAAIVAINDQRKEHGLDPVSDFDTRYYIEQLGQLPYFKRDRKP